ncbi:hypothetical protein H1P_820019 [Hyella patelloides LEGE 07179]|uniref:Uncharacterized protein n=1 Tax=Hyella patelloides LEGE 07179 TaxID=945734 RepID=A0A563W4F6_9CYAN|nr:hypothetical protein H1P_820019 [Hyella patelloides LEGE 07179]
MWQNLSVINDRSNPAYLRNKAILKFQQMLLSSCDVKGTLNITNVSKYDF